MKSKTIEPITIELEDVEGIVCGDADCIALPEMEEIIEEKLSDVEVPYDEAEFTRGIKIGSYLAGIASALIPLGFSEERVMEAVLSERTIEHNIEMMKLKLEHPVLSDYDALVEEECR